LSSSPCFAKAIVQRFNQRTRLSWLGNGPQHNGFRFTGLAVDQEQQTLGEYKVVDEDEG
jgi:hypothetical protein